MATTYEKERQLEQAIAPRIHQDMPDVDVLAVELLTPSRFCVYVDHPAGVDHALCAQVTSALHDFTREYTVDVSSPGLERPLRKPQHFASVVGRRVSLRTSPAVAGRDKFKGVLKDAGETSVTLGVDDADVTIPYEAIVRGNLIDEG